MITKRFLPLSLGILLLCSCYSDDAEEGLLEYKGHKYKTIIIDSQEVMAENLNFDLAGSKCYNDDPANCAAYGRLYTWIMAMDLPFSCTSLSCAEQVNKPHKGICPNGWHIPTNEEWDKLYHYADGTDWVYDSAFYKPYDSPAAGGYLKDSLGFAALPGGSYLGEGSFNGAGEVGLWWSASEVEEDAAAAYGRFIYTRYESASWSYNIKTYFFSVRCFKD